MRIDVLTLFPSMFAPVQESILRRAQEEQLIELHLHDIRDYGLGKYKQVDDTPYGGGAGMLMRVDVLVPAIEDIRNSKFHPSSGSGQNSVSKPYVIYLSPRGDLLTQAKVEQMAATHEWLLLICGHYEGIDQRVIDGYIDADGTQHKWVDEELSIGEYVLTGGELPAMVLIDAVSRHIPGVLGSEHSAAEESFSAALEGKKEYPHYTKPEEFRGIKVPEILLSGHHAKIKQWRMEHTQ